MHCIYCQRRSDNAQRVPHAFPQALGQNDYVLPMGAECDECNERLGALENVLTCHPIVSLMLQFLHVPGKKGRPRKRLGNVECDEAARCLTIPTTEPHVTTNPDGTRSAVATPLIPRNFQLEKFRRGLHRVCLNMLAYQDGVERVTAAEFDPVRAYIREGRGTSRPYTQRLNFGGAWRRDGAVLFPRVRGAEIVGFRVGGAAFAVDLLNTGHLKLWAEQNPVLQMELVDADFQPARAARPSGRRRYRLRIMLDD